MKATYQYRRKWKNLFTGAIECEYLLCNVIEQVSSKSLKIKILVTGEIKIVRIKNVIGYFRQHHQSIRMPYKD
jgi:hypothetical protein